MNSAIRLVREFAALGRILAPGDMLALGWKTLVNSPSILGTRRLTSLDAAMARNLTVHYRNSRLFFPLRDIDNLLAAHNDNPTFGNVREIYGHDVYMRQLNLASPIGSVLDLGANRGMFSLMGLVTFGASLVVCVEPRTSYDPVMRLLVDANQIKPERVVRYGRFITSPTEERKDPEKNVSIETICKEQAVECFGLVKIDIEGYEKDIFSEPAWLARVDNITMELHPQFAGDLSSIPAALDEYGFKWRATGQMGEPREVNKAMFLYASRTGALID